MYTRSSETPPVLGCIPSSVSSSCRKRILPLSSALVRPSPCKCSQLWRRVQPGSLYGNSTSLGTRLTHWCGSGRKSSFPPPLRITGRDKGSAGDRLMVILPPPLSRKSPFMTFEAPSRDFRFNTHLMREHSNVLQAGGVYNE